MSEQLESSIKQMSTEQLEDMLKLDTLSDDGLGEDITAAIVEILAERAAENEKTAINVDAMWKSFCEDYLPSAESGSLYLDNEELEQLASCENDSAADSLKQTNSFGKACNSKRKSLRVMLKVACTAVAIVMLFFSCIGIANAAGYDAWNKIASWTEEAFTFRERGGRLEMNAPTSHEPDGDGSYVSLQDALDAYGITTQVAPKWIPKEYAAESITVSVTGNSVDFFALYTSTGKLSNKDLNKGIYISIRFEKAANGSMQVQKDADGPEVYEVNGVDHYIMTNTADLVAVWQREDLECLIGGNDLASKDLKTIIDSIYWRR